VPLLGEVFEGHQAVIRFFGETQHEDGWGRSQNFRSFSVRLGCGWKQDRCGRSSCVAIRVLRRKGQIRQCFLALGWAKIWYPETVMRATL
jgi:hypothetical protein